MAPTARKNACAKDSCPVVPTSRFSPMAPTIAPNTANPVRSQNSSTYSGAISRTTSRTAMTISRVRERPGATVARDARVAPRSFVAVDSDTGQLLRPEQAGGADQQHDDHHHVRDDVAEPAPEEQQLVLVAGGQGLGEADQHPAGQRPTGRVESAEDGRREGPQG